MARLVTLAVYNRGNLSKTHQSAPDQAYSWRLLILPKDLEERRSAFAFEATTASEVDPTTSRLVNPSGDWWVRASQNLDPTTDRTLVGQIAIGEIPESVSLDEISKILFKVPRPGGPQQSGATWALDAIAAMQKQSWAWNFDLGRFKDVALHYSTERMRQGATSEPSFKYYGKN
ncbi:hypothetical protein NLG97_g6482 [Lecanicillium saksenae]|uniref:Uncharacterized protein n=1 Tax=Lecanicillium saksenae TaxID=468837 RepID=A0ACC1QR70_9HYPO|nr:hypothetical protein NLG97_g6482 [Lecanicillium saksenae]